MSNPESYIQIHSEARRELRYLAGDLLGQAEVFEEAGNPILARRLRNYANRLDENAERMDRAFHTALDVYFKSAQQSSLNVVNAVLAGLAIKEEIKE